MLNIICGATIIGGYNERKRAVPNASTLARPFTTLTPTYHGRKPGMQKQNTTPAPIQKRCAVCAALKCKCAQTLKACADCSTYTPIKALIERPDGREVCPTCQGKIERLAARKQQLDFFGQEILFN